jgi:ferritin heavy chain
MESIQSAVNIRESFPESSENAINDLVRHCLTASYTCKGIAYYYDRSDVALVGLCSMFKFCARIQSRWARDLMCYQVARGGETALQSIDEPEKSEWGTPVESLTFLLERMKSLKDQIEKTIKVARDGGDQHFKFYLKNDFLDPLIYFIRKIGMLITNAVRAGPGLGEYEFSKDIKLHFPDIFDAVNFF